AALLTTKRHSETTEAEKSESELDDQQRQQQRDAVWQELVRGAQLVQLGEAHEASLDHLAVVEGKRSVVLHSVAATDLGDVVVDESSTADVLEFGIDNAEFLRQFASGRIVV